MPIEMPVIEKMKVFALLRWACFAPARGDDNNNNRIFITREYDGADLKENGTIPF